MNPKYATIKKWCEMTGMSKSGTYNALAAGLMRAIKLGNKSLVDVEHGLAWLAAQPAATFRPYSNAEAA